MPPPDSASRSRMKPGSPRTLPGAASGILGSYGSSGRSLPTVRRHAKSIAIPEATSAAPGGACSNRGRRTSSRRCAPSARFRGTAGTGRTGIAVSGAQRLCFRVGFQPAGCRCVKPWPVLHARHAATARQSTLDLPVPPYTFSDENLGWEWRLLPTQPTSFQIRI